MNMPEETFGAAATNSAPTARQKIPSRPAQGGGRELQAFPHSRTSVSRTQHARTADFRPARSPRVAFLGVGWIGRHRLEAVVKTGVGEIVGIADPATEMLHATASLAPDAVLVGTLEELLELEPDGLVIATPSALHAEQSIAALERGVAVFCQKPLGRNAAEARRVVSTAQVADRLLAVDFSYRFTTAMRRIRELIQRAELGVYAVDLVFHNAYGPDKPWLYDRAQSGGGCVMDLGVHLVDLALWSLGFPQIERVSSRLYGNGRPQPPQAAEVEDFATAQLDLAGGIVVRIACSWRLHAGRDALIEASFYGTGGGAAMRNVDGSFFDFVAERYRGTSAEVLAEPPDAWGGRAIVDWVERLARGERFDNEAERYLTVAEALDAIYANAA
jgi:predicted dehydrogenase